MALPISYNIRSLLARWKVTLLAIGGIGLVVAVFVVLLAMAAGFRTVLRSSGRPGNAMVTQRGSASELTSWLGRANADFIQNDSRVARDATGQPMASCELIVLTSLPKISDGQPANITLRGVTPRAFQVRGDIKMLEGRQFTPGVNELIVGKRLLDRVRGVGLGRTMRMQNLDWNIVGVFDANGSAFESEIWGDWATLNGPFRRQGGCNSLTVRLADPASLKAFDEDLRHNPQFQVEAKDERQYYEDQAGPVVAPLTVLAVLVGFVMGVGAVFGAMNTMYAIVAARTREIATLRAVGFGRGSVLVAFVMESVFLAAIGGALGCLLTIPANGITTGSGQTNSFSEIAFAFRVTWQAMASGFVFAIVMGIIGGLLPALRAARLPIASALREA